MTPDARHLTLHVFCAHCAAEIEACRGAHGEWMHVATRYERCAGSRGVTAEPETPWQVEQRFLGKRRAS